MLFAKFLDANGMLMHPGPSGPVPVTMGDCADFAAENGAADGWDLAAKYAARMLPQIFRDGSPVFKFVLTSEKRQDLERLISDLPPELYAEPETLGWAYESWQARRKAEVNASEGKITARELPVVTQLFSEKFMVAFLLDNSLGAWWAAHRLSDADKLSCNSEDELRTSVKLPGAPLDYLRFVKDGDSPWTPAAGAFRRWPEKLSNFRLLDPCCGSGQFLVAAFRMLVPMRMEADGLSAREAVDAVLRENIHGLELDRRCVEIAVFSLAMAAWSYPGAGGYRPLPELNIACSGVPATAMAEDWASLAGDDIAARNALVGLHSQFGNAPLLGSLIDPGKDMKDSQILGSGWESALKVLNKAVSEDVGDLSSEIAMFASGAAKAAAVLAGSYHLIATNVPYLSSGKQSDPLKEHCRKYYPDAKGDLATVFIERCLRLCQNGGTIAAVTPQNWLSLTSYKNFRKRLLKECRWHLDAILGADAFETPMWTFNIQLIIMSKGEPTRNGEGFEAGEAVIRFVKASGVKGPAGKAELLASSEVASVSQARQLDNPDARVSAEELGSGELLERAACCRDGLQTGDNPRMRLFFWEFGVPDELWMLFRGTVGDSEHFGGMSYVLRWDGGSGAIDEIPGAYKRGFDAWGKRGVIVSQMRDLPVSLYMGGAFEHNTAVIVPGDADILPALWRYCSSPDYHDAVRKIDQALKVTNATLVKVPFDIEHWTEISKVSYPNGLPKPYSDDPTQWIFHGHPCGSVVWDDNAKHVSRGPLRTDGTVLHVAVARLLGYRWPSELDAEMELADEQREWIKRSEALSEFVDWDGIVAIPAVKGKGAAHDRLFDLLAASYGDAWSSKVMYRLLANSGHADGNLESWLRDKFFTQHCKLFQNRPFIWQVWDGRSDGFSALVNCHKFDRRLLESLIYAYLGDWIDRQIFDVKGGVEGAQARLEAAVSLQTQLEAIHLGEPPYDIFVRWKTLAGQPAGWNPDINDGVRLNIRPFMMEPDVGRKGAGILRDKPNIKYEKDRGKDAASAPWYHFDKGDRINDRHLKRSEKDKARS
jgi:hypothetical protein